MPMLSSVSNLVWPKEKKRSRHSVFALPAGFSGCAFWRFRLPLNKLIKLGTELDITIADNPNKLIRMEDVQKHVETSDLIALQSPGYKDAHTLMRLYRSENKKVVIDYDDYSFDLSPGNPRYAELGCSECELKDASGNLIYRWRDGENGFDLKSNIAKFEAFKQCVKDANLITVTTEYLSEKFSPYNKNVVICPNSIDFDLWKPLPRPAYLDNEIRIGWFGGDSHYIDLNVFKNILPRIVKKYSNVKIVMQAPPVPEWEEFFKDIPKDRLEWHTWVDLRYYTLFMASRYWDIGLCPLADNDFNRCKSSIKFFEFAAIGAAVVAENMLPYAENITHGANGFLAKTEDEWYEAICQLVENETLRKNIANNGYNYVHTNFNLDTNCRIWESHYLNCLER